MNFCYWLIVVLISFIASPLLIGVINRTKAVFAGRHGAPLLQVYFDIFKLFRRGSVYSTSTSAIFRIAPSVTLASLSVAALMIPYAGFTAPALCSFKFDIIFFIYVFAVGRFMTVLASLDTASAFSGMGASREVQFSALAEPAFMIALCVLALQSGAFNLNEIFTNHEMMNIATRHGDTIFLAAAALFIVMLLESCRVPFDDPATHLELTMIHEAMILDYSGRDLAMIFYAATLKIWIFASIVILTIIPFNFSPSVNIAVFTGGVFAVGIAIGTIESIMARFRFVKIPQMILSALALALLALIRFLLGGH